jgi:FlaA1/EpsC-like NDP-sugar epimerase
LEVILPTKLRMAANSIEHASLAADLRALGLTLRTVFVPNGPIRQFRRIMSYSAFWKSIESRMIASGNCSRWLAIAADALVVLACWHITYLFRLGFERWQPGRPWYDDYVSWGVVVVYMVALELAGARKMLWRYFALDDLRRIALACLGAGIVSAFAVLMAQLVGVARAVLVLHPFLTLIALAGTRMVLRMFWEHAHAFAEGEGSERRYAIVLGGDETGRRLIAGLHGRHGWQVLMVLDDDESLHGIRIGGITVAGHLARVRDPSLTAGATHAVVAVSEPQARQRALALAADSGLTVVVVPFASELEVVASNSASAR